MDSPAFRDLIEALRALPGIGPRSAERIAFHILRSPADEARRLARAIEAVRSRTARCSSCYTMSETDPCGICRDESRDRKVVCVVGDTRDVHAFERSGRYRGLYHVLHGEVDPLAGVDERDLTTDALVERLRKGGFTEVILATNPTAEGDATAFALAERLRPLGVAVTRLARGLPPGASLELSSVGAIADALENRRPVEGIPAPAGGGAS